MTYPLKPGDTLVQQVCGYCKGPIDFRYLGQYDKDDEEKRQKLIYYRNLELDEVPVTWKMGKPARYMPFCSAKCGLMYYEKEVLKREDFASFSTQEIG